MALEVGTKAPEVSGTLADGSHWSTSDARGKTLVLYFYPKDFTPGCTLEACSFRDAYEDLAGPYVLSIVRANPGACLDNPLPGCTGETPDVSR